MKQLFFLLYAAIAVSQPVQSQPNHSGETSLIHKNRSPIISYILTVNEEDLSSYNVSMHLKNVPGTFKLAMVKHFEYDDRFWRFIKELKVNAGQIAGRIERLDSALWKISTDTDEVVVSYRIQLPTPPAWRGSWKPFLTANGGLVGDRILFSIWLVVHTFPHTLPSISRKIGQYLRALVQLLIHTLFMHPLHIC